MTLKSHKRDLVGQLYTEQTNAKDYKQKDKIIFQLNFLRVGNKPTDKSSS